MKWGRAAEFVGAGEHFRAIVAGASRFWLCSQSVRKRDYCLRRYALGVSAVNF
jgi:hypothetical protein